MAWSLRKLKGAVCLLYTRPRVAAGDVSSTYGDSNVEHTTTSDIGIGRLSITV